MSDVVENRIVELEFDNSRFQGNVDDSLKSLKRLNKSLELSGAKGGLDDINDIVKKMSFAGLEKSIDSIAAKFSNLGIIGTTALMNITNKAVDAGTHIVKSLSIDQLSAGWRKYEDMIAAEQTIISATGKTQLEVNEALDQLLWYTDETSYNFIDMANSIGKFTSNNVDLFDSVDAMQGIASWAAISGQRAQQASMAMYNISQAMGMGYVSVADWRSIELANMATAAFKDIAIEAGRAVGTLVEYDLGGETLTIPETSIAKLEEWNAQLAGGKLSELEYENNLNSIAVSVETFRNTLSTKWFDKDVLKTTLTEYGRFPTMLYESIQTIGEDNITATGLLGYLDEYKNKTLDISVAADETGVSAAILEKELKKLSATDLELSYKAFKAAQEAKTFTDVLDATKDAVSSSWMNIYKSIFGDYEEAKKIWTPIAEEAYDLFAEPVNRLGLLIEKFKDTGGIDALFKGISNVYTSIKNVIGGISGGIKTLLGLNDGARIVDILTKINKGFLNLTEKLKITEDFGTRLSNLLEPFSRLGGTILETAKKISDIIGKLAKDGLTALGGIFVGLGTSAMNFFSNINSKLSSGLKNLKKTKESVNNNYVKPVGKAALVAESLSLELDNISNSLKEFSLAGLAAQIKETATLLKEKFLEYFDKFKTSFTDGKINKFFGDIQTGITNFGTTIKKLYNQIKDTGSLSLNTIWNGLKTFFTDLTNFILKTVVPEIPIIFENIISSLADFINGISDGIGQIKKSISEHRDGIQEAWSNLFAPIKDEARKIGKETVEEIAAGASEAADDLEPSGEGEKSGTGSSLIMRILGIGYLGKELVIDTIREYNAATLLGGVRDFLKSFGDIADSISGALDKIGGIKVTSKAQKAISVVKELGKGMLMMGIAVLIFSSIPEDELKSAAGTVAHIAGTLALLITGLKAAEKYLGKMSTFSASWKRGEGVNARGELSQLPGLIISFGVAILLIALAIKAVTATDELSNAFISRAAGRIAIIMLLLAGCMLVISYGIRNILEASSDILDTKDAAKMINRFGNVILDLGISMLLVAWAMKILTNTASTDLEAFSKVENFFFWIYAILVVAVLVTEWIKTKAQKLGGTNIDIELFANPILSLGIAILLIAAATAWLVGVVGKSEENMKAFEKVEGLIKTIVITLAILAAVKEISKKWEKGGGGISSDGGESVSKTLAKLGASLLLLAIGIAAVAASMIVIVGAAALIAGILTSSENAIWALLGMFGFMLVLVGLCGLIGKDGWDSEIKKGAGAIAVIGLAMIPIAIGLIAMAAAIFAIGVAFSLVQSLGVAPFDAFAAAVILVLAACVACSYLSDVAGEALLGAAALAVVGIAFAVAAVAIGIGGALMISGAGLMLDGIAKIGEALTWKKVGNIAKGLAVLLATSFGLMLVGGFLTIAALDMIVPIIILSIAANSLLDLMAVLLIAGNNGDAIVAGFENFSNGLGKILETLSEYGKDSRGIIRLARAIRIISKSSAALVALGINGIFGGDDGVDGIDNAADELSENASTITEATEQLAEAKKEIANTTLPAQTTVQNGVQVTMSEIDTTNVDGQQLDIIGNVIGLDFSSISLESLKGMSTEQLTQLFSQIGLDPSQFMGENGEFNLDALETMFSGIAPAYEQTADSITASGEKIVTSTSQTAAQVQKHGKQLAMANVAAKKAADEITTGTAESVAKADATMTSSTEAVEKQASSSGAKVFGAINKGFGVYKNIITGNYYGALGKIMTTSVTNNVDGEKPAQYFISGIVSGLQNGEGLVGAAAKSLALTILDELNGGLGISSPSKFAYESGQYFDLGLLNAINDGAPQIMSATENLGNNAVDALGRNVGRVSSILNGKYSPRVAPVMDTSSYNSGLSYLTSSFNSARRTIAKNAETIKGAKDGSTTIKHEFSDLTVRGVDDNGTFVGVANYAVDEILAKQMRRQYRV